MCLVLNVGGVLALLITLALHCSVHDAHPRIGIEVCNDIVNPFVVALEALIIIPMQGK